MRGYKQLAREQRYQIEALLKAGKTQAAIADTIGVDAATISRELKRNRGQRGYRGGQADGFADQRRQGKQKDQITSETWAWVDQLLREDWSPEQISGWLAENEGVSISHEWIYQYIYEDKRQGGNLHSHLRCQKARRKRYGSNDRRGRIRGRVSIEERPGVVDDRTRIGDWEADTVIGKQGGPVLVTLVERKSRFSLIALAWDKSATAVKESILTVFKPVANQVHTVTYDNGKEFAYHQEISKELDSEAYFAHPYHSWERGLNENTNGLIRQYLPKGIDLRGVSSKTVRQIENKLNNRPRKCLGFKTPNEVFYGTKTPVALTS